MTFITRKSDFIGSLSSSLCLLHCLATPFFFLIEKGGMSCCLKAPKWWLWMDNLFLGIAFFAVYFSAQTSSKNWIKVALWLSWAGLCLVIFNEHFKWLPLLQQAIYLPTFSLILLHLLNLRYCGCKEHQPCRH